ncbi:hypothetical protein [Actinomadura opuntiae]|uniref:hypothetical protein n=1 Tax=Actinomadura sp. OS1-43 TaxID=604315 RepID=UPI00255A855E|nr:hypothetical protein [Actinomadura sp. OS1-43]MDL4820428.1 hypothetical protein [Actinomadura sp. OS1-43]
MPAFRTREPVLLDPQGPVITMIACVVGGILMLGAGAAAVFCAVLAATGIGGTRGGWTWAAAGLALFSAFVASVGLSTVVSARAERRATIRLAAHGVEATALVLAVSSAPPTNDHHFQVRLLMRISGPGFASFESSNELPRYRVGSVAQGTVLPARVDPSTLVFTLERPPAPDAAGTGS